MDKTRKLLKTFFIVSLVVAIVVIVLFETETLPTGVLAEEKQSEFLLVTLMELTTLGGVFLALRLFKFEAVHRDLVTREAAALLKWGLVRLALLLVPMLVNTLLYYIYMNTTFGYMAIMQFLCLPFVFPSAGRCLAETTEDEGKSE
ncbi:MAG: hypothetical protein IJ059_00880 [Prevotella sp.]|nr:hypothetical protein [Prevotella sp.]